MPLPIPDLKTDQLTFSAVTTFITQSSNLERDQNASRPVAMTNWFDVGVFAKKQRAIEAYAATLPPDKAAELKTSWDNSISPTVAPALKLPSVAASKEVESKPTASKTGMFAAKDVVKAVNKKRKATAVAPVSGEPAAKKQAEPEEQRPKVQTNRWADIDNEKSDFTTTPKGRGR